MAVTRPITRALTRALSFPASGRRYPSGSPDFVFTVKTDNTGSSNDDQFTIPFAGTPDCTVIQPDGTETTVSSAGNVTLTFADGAGTYECRIVGDVSGVAFNNGGDRLKLLDVSNWGDGAWSTFNTAFYGCANLDISATDAPNLTGVESFVRAFQACTVLVGASLSEWRPSDATDMFAMFLSSPLFNAEIGAWDVSNVTRMTSAFSGANVFNGDISAWDTGAVTQMASMFANADAFNQDIGGWDTSVLANVSGMFLGANLFDQNLAAWDVADVTSAGNFMLGATLSTANYDATLIGWAAQTVQSGLTISFGNSTYTTGGAAEAARTTLTGAPNSWSITDGGGV